MSETNLVNPRRSSAFANLRDTLVALFDKPTDIGSG